MLIRFNNQKSSRSGQSLILAIVIMFLLSFLGIIFIAMVTRNLFRAGRSSEMLKVEQLAKAGVDYADAMLTRGQDGADWRPTPEQLTLPANDPDVDWLNITSPNPKYPTMLNFTRISSGEGRFLLRVSYNPDPTDPMSKYIKIESIGRMGTVDPNDPTTLATASKHKLRFEMTAYKPIGLTDYARFITNKEKRSVPMALGFPGYSAQFGRPADSNVAGDTGAGGPIRVNGNLLWTGVSVDIYLRGVPATGVDTAEVQEPLQGVEVSGEITHALTAPGSGTSTQVTVHRLNDSKNFAVVASQDPAGFSTAEGFYRDGSDAGSIDKGARAVRRIEPPILNLYDQASGTMRYRALTRNSGDWKKDQSGTWFNTGYFGWGRGIYINNNSDVQRESETLFGGYTLRGDWMKPNNEISPYWRGPFYVPPGVQITLNPVDTDGDKEPDITLTRTDLTRDNRRQVWVDASGAPMPAWGATVTMKYPQNGVIYAEGNIRIKGMLPPNKQLTVVSGATIYIEGSILKYRDRQTPLAPDQFGSIALLATDYVCVNTTQFVSLLTEAGPTSIGSDSQNGEPPFHLIIGPDPVTNFRTAFTFGPASYLTNADFTDIKKRPPFISARHAGQYESAYINMWINRGDDGGGMGLYNFGPWAPNSWVYGVADPQVGGTPGVGLGSVFEHKSWPLQVDTTNNLAPVGILTPAAGYPNYIEVGLDQTSFVRNNYLLSGFAVQPLDVVIEAIIYAQNKSFFIIPGQWFNPNPDDTEENYVKRGVRPIGTSPHFPYFGQPLDIKITVNGAVTENTPAAAGDTSDWAAKWCGIPAKYGSSDDVTYHPNEGITFTYDELMGCPVILGSPNAYLRMDSYGRPLPAAPKLPVSPTLIFYGQAI